MNSEQVEAVVKSTVVEYLNVPPEQLHPATTWTELKADSLARIELTLALEDTFKVVIPDEAAARFNTLADVVSYLQKRVGTEPARP